MDDFQQFEKGPVGEIRAQLLYALDLGYLEHERFEQLNELGNSNSELGTVNVPPCAA